MDTEQPLEVRIAAILAEMKEHELWNTDVPGINGWTFGDMIEEMIRHDIFDPTRDTLHSLYEEFERKHQADLEKNTS